MRNHVVSIKQAFRLSFRERNKTARRHQEKSPALMIKQEIPDGCGDTHIVKLLLERPYTVQKLLLVRDIGAIFRDPPVCKITKRVIQAEQELRVLLADGIVKIVMDQLCGGNRFGGKVRARFVRMASVVVEKIFSFGFFIKYTADIGEQCVVFLRRFCICLLYTSDAADE